MIKTCTVVLRETADGSDPVKVFAGAGHAIRAKAFVKEESVKWRDCRYYTEEVTLDD